MDSESENDHYDSDVESEESVDSKRPKKRIKFSESANRDVETKENEKKRTLKMKEEKRLSVKQQKFSFLDNPLDEQKRKPGDPDYDPRTLYIPRACLLLMTSFERQYWEIKQKYFDSVVFFKKGKFFELFETDAEIGQKVLGLKMTDRVSMRMVGIPCDKFDYWAGKLVHQGFKVTCVEQTESVIGKSKRTRDDDDGSTVLKREVSRIITPGTLVSENLLKDHNANYLLSIVECILEYGICFVDTATGIFHMAYFKDDLQKTQLRSLLFRIRPTEIIYQKDSLQTATMALLRNNVTLPLFTPMNPAECLSPSAVKQRLNTGGYFIKENINATSEDWPEAIVEMQENEVAMKALGNVVVYLTDLKLDKELISLKNFVLYQPLKQSSNLVLDAKGLENLEILENATNLELDGSLLKVLNHCVTAFGKRMMRRWVCHPLFYVEEIEDRLNAVEDLMNENQLASQIRSTCSHLPDLERMISRIHARTSSLADLLSFLNGFELIVELLTGELIDVSTTFTSKRLKYVSSIEGESGGGFPDIQEDFAAVVESFNREDASERGKIVPMAGFDETYDTLCESLKSIEHQLNDILEKQQKSLGSKKVAYKDVGKEKYLLDVPIELTAKLDTKVYKPMSRTQKSIRYRLASISALLPKLEETKEELAFAESKLLTKILEAVDVNRAKWLNAIQCIAEIDCLLSLAAVSSSRANLCRPRFVPKNELGFPVLHITDLYHPAMVDRMGDRFIPNDVSLGVNGEPNVILITGPNMGGKSTVLRSVGTTVVLAQLGCYVNASSYTATPVDRIFTRLGANDNIFENRSTFMVELQETASVLNEGTSNSLVLLDELGRGTSTFDGYSIAFSVMTKLTAMKCNVLFATHYHLLTEDFYYHPQVALKHMAVRIDDGNNDDVTFLYKLVDGICPKSYGMKVAQMAGMPESVRTRAKYKAEKFEEGSILTTYKSHSRRMGENFRDQLLLGDLYQIENLEQAQFLHERLNYLLGRGIFNDSGAPDCEEMKVEEPNFDHIDFAENVEIMDEYELT